MRPTHPLHAANRRVKMTRELALELALQAISGPAPVLTYEQIRTGQANLRFFTCPMSERYL